MVSNTEKMNDSKQISRAESAMLMDDVRNIQELQSGIKLGNILEHSYHSNVWGESDVPEVKWFTDAKKRVLGGGVNSKYKKQVNEAIEDILLGWSNSIDELNGSIDTILYVLRKVKEHPEERLSLEDYVFFLAHRVVAVAILSRLALTDPEKLPDLNSNNIPLD